MYLSYFLEIILQEGEQFAQDNGMFYMETSAKTSQNINELFHEIGKSSSVIWGRIIWLNCIGTYSLLFTVKFDCFQTPDFWFVIQVSCMLFKVQLNCPVIWTVHPKFGVLFVLTLRVGFQNSDMYTMLIHLTFHLCSKEISKSFPSKAYWNDSKQWNTR